MDFICIFLEFKGKTKNGLVLFFLGNCLNGYLKVSSLGDDF